VTHRLDPLLRPESIAVVGASEREDSLGEWALKNVRRGGFSGDVFPVNPKYEKLQTYRCYPHIAALPKVPDLVIFAVGDSRIEAALDEAISLGVPAVVIHSTLHADDDKTPFLSERIRKKLADSGTLACGANGMGFYNVRDRVWATGFDSCHHEAPGNVALISQSGSGMCSIVDCEDRLRFNFAVSTGNELSVSMDEYLDFVLDLPETDVVGLFVETARNPDSFRAALEKAARKKIPIVALKVGRTEEAAQLSVSHAGAMAGDDATYDALFDRYGVQRVHSMEELATALIVFSEMHPVGDGGLVALHDSGGLRQLLVDLADEIGVPLTRLSSDTVANLESIMDPELPAVNPLDAWSRGGSDAGEMMRKCLSLLVQDPGAAVGAAFFDRAPDGYIYENYLERLRQANVDSGKPVALVSSWQGTGSDRQVVDSTHAGYPILDSVPNFLKSVRALFAYRDFLERPDVSMASVESQGDADWVEVLRSASALGETESLEILAEYGLPVCVNDSASNKDEALAAAINIGYPLALKTAVSGIFHKSDIDGVILNIVNDKEFREAYDDLSARLGPQILVAEMAKPGVEMFLGVKRDPQFGPVMIMGVGGIHAELLKDVVYALPPFDSLHASRLVRRLRLSKILDGHRGRPPSDILAFCDMASQFSVVVDQLRDVIVEADINPVIVHEHGCTIVDALIVGSTNAET
jgi:acyl-CoA synthetase (NDP forming)